MIKVGNLNVRQHVSSAEAAHHQGLEEHAKLKNYTKIKVYKRKLT